MRRRGTLRRSGGGGGGSGSTFAGAVVELGQNSQFGAMPNAMVDASKAMGATWLRGGPEWSFHASKAAFTTDVASAGSAGVWPALATFQSQCAYAHSQGCKVLAVALAAPPWARGTDGTGNAWHQALLPTERTSFAEYARQLLLAGADAIEVVNEPNLANQYRFGPSHPRAAFQGERVDDYVLLLQAVYTRCKADPLTASKPVGIGAPAVSGHEQMPEAPGGAIHPTTWYQRLFNSTADDRTTPITAAGYFDFACVHPYANAGATPTDWDVQWTVQPGDAVYWQGVALVWRIRQALVAAGCANAKIWATEFGAPTAGTGGGTVSEATQATWMHDYARAWFSIASSGYAAPLSPSFYGAFTGPMIVYQWRDQSDGVIAPTTREGFFGLQRFDGTAKPAVAAFLAESTRRKGNF